MNQTLVVFDPREERFKKPYGAIVSDTVIALRIYVHQSMNPRSARVIFLYDRHRIPAVYEMKRGSEEERAGEYIPYEVSFPVHDTGLYWYHFEISGDGWNRAFACTDQGCVPMDSFRTREWQQTVYRREYDTPDWLYGGVIYHIFVDRFCHVGPYVPQEGKVLRKDWGGMPEYRPWNGRIMNNDFFGGNLQGIISKLPYLEELGVTCLYLSPIFEAYSNHKYDTANYMKIDPAFGTEADFRELCSKARERGIHVILDGVFSHTGSDSVYFDRYGHYGGKGAWNNPGSPYRSWYYFNPDGTYQSWWGIDTLPRLNKLDPGYTQFICGEDGVARKWLKAGADGWRLDVADELPNVFIEKLAAGIKTAKPNAVIIGEVWEDASTKIAYDERKNYFEGDKLDSVMNYPFKDAIIDFVRNGNAWRLSRTVEQINENYPTEVRDALMNILGTHDTKRIITALAGRNLEPASREREAMEHMSGEEWQRGIALLKIACAIQMTLPGVPCIYYGDEAGVEGYSDPFNRKCYPWGHENRDLQDWYRRMIEIRRSHIAYARGKYRTAAAFNGLYAFERYCGIEPEADESKPAAETGSLGSKAVSDADRPAARRQAGSAEEGAVRALSDKEQRLITAANCGTQVEELMLYGAWRDLITGAVAVGNTYVFPGEVMILEKIDTTEEVIDMSYEKEYQKWLDCPFMDEKTMEELRSLEDNEGEIKERFSAMLNFGTAGLRGIMRAGLNGMNVYTVRYATQGLADLILSCGEPVGSGVSIAYDSRNNSPEFARESACVLAGNGIHVNLFESLRPTPELSFALRETGSIAGINITASHNTKEYNGYKVYWSDGAQLPPEHAAKVSESMEKLDIFNDVKTMDYEEARNKGLIDLMGAEMDEKYLARVQEQSVGASYVAAAADEFKVVYTPFHGTGYKLVPEILKRVGIKNVITVPEQMVIDGNFPTVKSPNPEYREGFTLAIDLARKNNVDLIIGTDPDGDRCGIVVRNGDDYETLTGNQIGVLLLDYLITARRENGTLAANSAAVKSIVSTTMANAVCKANDITLFEVLTGFKFIGEKIKEFEADGSHTFLFGFEESNGYLSGTYARDKDAVVASMLIAEMGCMYHLKGMNLYQAMQELYKKYGYFREKVESVVFEGLDGQARMAGIMDELRKQPPAAVGLPVVRVRDYQAGTITAVGAGSGSAADGSAAESGTAGSAAESAAAGSVAESAADAGSSADVEPTGLPSSNVLFYELADGCSAIVRPSGTEPKIKLYVMAQGTDAAEVDARLDKIRTAGMELLKSE